MSGGFFRGTSADQDTRFSNKQAKLLKSQKFASELDHLVDMRKVKMEVIRPWIATRVTELLGFEDEVLINFIYGLLDAKEVNGKEVQISLTGFMEKNTGKFMKELWTLLLSAQKNESGVPQQFLDAKEEETRKQQAEVDRITNEIQKKKEKEGKEFELQRLKKMDGGAETKANLAAVDPASKHMLNVSTGDLEDERETEKSNGVRGRDRPSRSPHSADRSSSSPRGSPSRNSRSFSNSRSLSGDRHKSRNLSRSPKARRQSISSDRVYHSPEKRSSMPRRRYSRGSLSPLRRRSLYLRRRSRSSSRRRSPPPVRHRLHSPYRRRSPSLIRRRLPSPVRDRRSPSPVRRRRSPSLIRRRRSPSPLRHQRSPSPVRRGSRSPVRRRSPSPVQRRSPLPMHRRSSRPQHRSPSPYRWRYQRSPSAPRRSPSPRHRSPVPARRRSPVPSSRRSPSPYESSSLSPVQHRSPSPIRRSSNDHRRSPVQAPVERVSLRDKSPPVPLQPSNYLRSPQRDAKDQKDLCDKLSSVSPSPVRSPVLSESPLLTRTRSSSEGRRSTSPYESPVRQIRGRRNRSSSPSAISVRQRKGKITHDESLSPPQKPREHKSHRGNPESSKEEEDTDLARDYKSRSSLKRSMYSSITSKQKGSPGKVHSKDEHSPERVVGRQDTESWSRLDIMESRKKDQEIKSEKSSRKGAYPDTPEREGQKDHLLGERQQISHAGEGKKSDEKKHSYTNNVKNSERRQKSETMQMLAEKADHNNFGGAFDSGSEESKKRKTGSKEKRKHKRLHREEMASDDDYSDPEIEERKKAKRRRKEEKKVRNEEKRRRREERRRRKEERRVEKLKLKDLIDNSSNDENAGRDSHPSDSEDAHSEQKKLVIELRKKALESLKAKKGISH